MNDAEFRKFYLSDLIPFVDELISASTERLNKQEYIKDCWVQLEIKLKQLELSEANFRDINAKFRRKIENEILK